MAQKAQVIDLTKSYLPWDPNAVMANYVSTEREDGEEKAIPVVPYEGWNFLPTAYGYKSYFGLNGRFAIPPLTSRAQYVLLYQGLDFNNSLVALCEDGIWISAVDGTAWSHVVTVAYDPDVFEEWTWTVIENVLYMYHQGDNLVYTYKGEFTPGTSPVGYLPLNYGGNRTDPKPVIDTVFFEEGGSFTEGDSVVLQVAKIDETGGVCLLSDPVTINVTGSAFTYNKLCLTLAIPAVVGEVYRIHGIIRYNYISDVIVEYADYVVTGDGILRFINTYSYLIEPGTSLDLYALTDNSIVAGFEGLTPPITVNSFTANLVPDTGEFAFPAGNYSIYLSQNRWGDPNGSMARYKLPIKVGDIPTTESGLIYVNFDVTVSDDGDALFPAGRYDIFFYNNDTRELYPADSYMVALGGSLLYELTVEFDPIYNTKANAVVSNQGQASPLGTAPVITVDSFTPSFLNMAGQMGIFRASTRLGFWDSANSVSWSSNFDLTDFEPSLENLAGNTIFGDVKGRIVTIKPYGTGFIIYSTKSIVGVSENLEGSMLWDGNSIFDEVGIAYSKAVCNGQTDAEHYIFSNQGIFHINGFNSVNKRYPAEPILSDLYDFLKEDRRPVALTCLGSRYICFSLIDDKYINGRVTFERKYVHPLVTNVKLSEGYWDGDISVLPSDADGNLSYQMLKTTIAGNAGGLNVKNQRYWRTRWDGEIVRMDKEVYTNMERLSWVRDIPGYTHPDQSKHYVLAIATAVNSIDTKTEIDVDALTPLYTMDPEGFYKAGDISIDFTDLTYSGDTGFSALDEADVGSKIFLQMNEWENFQVTQKATADYIHNKEAPEGLTGYPKTFLAGDGLNKLIIQNDRQMAHISLRRYFTHEYRISIVNTPEYWPAFTVDLFSPTGISSSPTPRTDFGLRLIGTQPVNLKELHEIVVSHLGDDPFGLFDFQFSINTTEYSYKYTDLPEGIPGYTQVPDLKSYYQSVMATIASTLFINPSDTIFIHNYRYAGRHSGPVVPFPQFEAYVYTDANSVTDVSGPLIWSYYASVHSFFFQNVNKDKYQVQKIPITETVYSQADFNLTFWDLIEPKIGGGYRLIASYQAKAKKRIPFDNLYPDYSSKPPTVQNNAGSFWTIVDKDGNEIISRIPMDFNSGMFGEHFMHFTDPDAAEPLITPGYTIAGSYHPPVVLEFTLPGAEFLLQDGSISPLYNDFAGALVYDSHLKKWGKFAAVHKLIIETAPVNTNKDGIISYTDFGTDGGILDANGFIRVFDSEPHEGYIAYGKIGYYRLGVTHALEGKFGFRFPFTGSITIDYSMDGRSIDTSLRQTDNFYEVVDATVFLNQRARWAILKISGNYDLQYLEFRGNIAGRR